MSVNLHHHDLWLHPADYALDHLLGDKAHAHARTHTGGVFQVSPL